MTQDPVVPAVPSAFYVTVRNGAQTILALGPFARHARALGHVEQVRRAVGRAGLDPWRAFGYGTSRSPLRSGLTVGAFGEVFGVAPDIRRVTLGAPQRVGAPVLDALREARS